MKTPLVTSQNDSPGFSGFQQRPFRSLDAVSKGFRRRLGLLAGVVMVATVGLHAENIVFPSGTVLNVKDAPYNARGDGSTDDTAAINRALADATGTSRSVYLPNGTYRITDTLNVGAWSTMIGQSEAGVVLKLDNNRAGFSSKSSPKNVMQTWTGSGAGQVLNMQFNIYIRHLTVDTGSGNPGAVGISSCIHNGGGPEYVTVRSGDGHGYAGIGLNQPQPGPQYIQRVTISGFDYGFLGSGLYHTTMEYVTLQNQRVAGIYSDGLPLTIRKLVSTNTVPAVLTSASASLENPQIVLVDSELRGGSSSAMAIDIPKGRLFARNITTAGYQASIRDHGVIKAGTGSVSEYASVAFTSLFGGTAASLQLPIKETLPLPWDPLANWVNVQDYSSLVVNGDWAPAIQAAIDSGKSTVYFPRGEYKVATTVRVRNNAQVLRGLGVGLDCQAQPTFIVENGNGTTVFLDNLGFQGANWTYHNQKVIHASSRALVFKHCVGFTVRNSAGCGDLFIDDAALSFNVQNALQLDYAQNVYCRDLNPEGDQQMILNNAATLWILGLKTEGGNVVIRNKQSALTEVLGGLDYDNGGSVAFVNEGGQMSVVSWSWYGHGTCATETRGGTTRSYAPPRTDATHWFYAANYGYTPQVVAPAFSPAPGTYTSGQSVTISTTTSGATIRYTTDGSNPSSSVGTLYSTPVNLSATTTLKAIAYKSGMTDSAITSGTYTINAGQSTYGNNGNPWAIAASGATRIQAENYDQGGQGVAYNDTSSGNIFNTYRADDVDVETCGDTGGGHDVGFVSAGEWVEYTVNVAAAGTYDLKLRVARGVTGTSTVRVLSGSTDLTGTLTVPSTGGWQTYTDLIKTGVSLAAGQQVIRIDMLGTDFNVNWIEFAAASPASTVTVTASTANAAEPNANGVFTFTRTGSTAAALTVNFTVGGTATSGSDYTSLGTTVSISAGSASATKSVSVIDDTTVESSESVVVTLATGSGYTVGSPSSATVTIADNDTSGGTGTGLTGIYFNNKTLSGAVELTRTEAVDFFWTASPGTGINADSFSVRWTGQVEAPTTGGYIFRTVSDDGVKLFVNGNLVIDNWTDHGSTANDSTSINLTGGTKYNLTMEFYDNGYDAVARLQWQTPGTGTFVAIPASRLYNALPSPWTAADIGTPGVAGSQSYNAIGGTWTINASGTDIWDTTDQFRFVSQSASGDCEIKARVTFLEGTDPWAKAGVMIRETSNANSKFADMVLTPGNGVSFQYRTATGGGCGYAQSTGKTAPYWVRLVRTGNNITGYMSPDGVTWTQVGTTQAITMTTGVSFGLAVTSHNNATLGTAIFDNVTAIP